MSFRDLTILTNPIGDRNGVEYFEFVAAQWGDEAVADNQALRKRLNVGTSLAGVAIGPSSSVGEVLIIPDYTSIIGTNIQTGSEGALFDNVESDLDSSIGFTTTRSIAVSAQRPFFGFLPGRLTLTARFHTRYLSDDGFPAARVATLVAGGGAGSFRVADENQSGRRGTAKLQVFLYTRTPMLMPQARPPMIDSAMMPISGGGDLFNQDVKSYPISSRKRIELQLASVGGTSVDVRVALMRTSRGSLAGNFPGAFVEEEIVSATTLVTAGANVVEVKRDDPGAQWLVVYGGNQVGGATLHMHLRAYD